MTTPDYPENRLDIRIDEHGNMVATTAVDDDSIVMQNQKEVEDPTILAYNADTRSGYMNNCVFLGDSRTVATFTPDGLQGSSLVHCQQWTYRMLSLSASPPAHDVRMSDAGNGSLTCSAG